MTSLALNVPGTLSAQMLSSRPQQTVSWRFRDAEEGFRPLAWLVAFTSSFFLIGLAGVLREDLGMPFILLSSASAPAGLELASEETTMAELQAMSETEPLQEEVEVRETVEPPTFAEALPDLQDLPELIPALVTEDLFAVPAAPPLETALTPQDPPKPRPAANRTPSPARPSPRPAARAPSSSGGGTGGSGISSTGGGGRFPTPPYPTFARSRGIQGSVMLTIVVNAAGAVESAIVSGSTGYSELDSYAASWVRRNWRFPAGTPRSFKLPVVFKLR